MNKQDHSSIIERTFLEQILEKVFAELSTDDRFTPEELSNLRKLFQEYKIPNFEQIIKRLRSNIQEK